MNDRVRSTVLFAGAFAGTVVVLACVAMLIARGRSIEVLFGLWIFQNAPSGILMLWLGAVVLRRVPGHAAGRILYACGALQVCHVTMATAADTRLVPAGFTAPLVGEHGLVPAQLPLDAAIPLLLMNVLWVPAAVLIVCLPLVFPDGRLPSPRWRWTIPAAGFAIAAMMIASAVDAWPTASWDADPPAVVPIAFLAGGASALVVAVAGITAFIVRWRRARSDERRFAVLGISALVCAVLAIATYPWPAVWVPTVHVAINALVVMYAVSAARFRLHDLEPVIGKGIVAGPVSIAVLIAYLGVATAVGVATASAGEPVLGAVLVGTFALGAEPVRRTSRRLVERGVFRRSGGPADVITRMTHHAQDAANPEAVVRESVELLLRRTGARGVAFRARGVAEAVQVGVVDGQPLFSRAVSFGETALGDLDLYSRAAVDLTAGAEQLLDDVARILALALHSHALAAQVSDQLDELRDSRERLVHAQEAARRRLERDLHDGAQARIIALKLRVETLRASSATHGADTGLDAALAVIAAELDAITHDLRELSRGVRPLLLTEAGVGAALRTHVRRLPMRVVVEDDHAHRFPPAIESAAYFACLEAIQNSLRHSAASVVRVRVGSGVDALAVTIVDDGIGFDVGAVTWSGLRGIEDRVGALGGRLVVTSEPGTGTSVHARIAAQPSLSAR